MKHHINILLGEDDPNLSFLIKEKLEQEGYEVTHAADGNKVLASFSEQIDLCLLDVMMPNQDGFELTQQIRQINQKIPIILLTARSLQEDIIKGLQLGADDYITKPFSMKELLLRIQVFLRRSNTAPLLPAQIILGKITYEPSSLKLTSPNGSIKLTSREAAILTYFCEHLNCLLKREQILMAIWGDDDYFMGRSLDVYISKLRKYLKADPNIYIENYHSLGFKLVAPV